MADALQTSDSLMRSLDKYNTVADPTATDIRRRHRLVLLLTAAHVQLALKTIRGRDRSSPRIGRDSNMTEPVTAVSSVLRCDLM